MKSLVGFIKRLYLFGLRGFPKFLAKLGLGALLLIFGFALQNTITGSDPLSALLHWIWRRKAKKRREKELEKDLERRGIVSMLNEWSFDKTNNFQQASKQYPADIDPVDAYFADHGRIPYGRYNRGYWDSGLLTYDLDKTVEYVYRKIQETVTDPPKLYFTWNSRDFKGFGYSWEYSWYFEYYLRDSLQKAKSKRSNDTRYKIEEYDPERLKQVLSMYPDFEKTNHHLN